MLIWLKFKRWLRAILFRISMGLPIDWNAEIKKLITILNQILNKRDRWIRRRK